MPHSNKFFLVAVNGKGSLLYGDALANGNRPAVKPLRRKDAEKLAEEWPIQGQIVIYQLVPVKNVWHDAPKGQPL